MLDKFAIKEGVNPCGKDKSHPKVKGAGNSPLWRVTDEVMLKNVASYSFADPVGFPMGEDPAANTPGVAILEVVPSYGTAIGDNAALVKASNAMWTYLTQGFTGTNVSFMASDLFCMTQAIYRGLFPAIIEGKRVYGLLRRYSNYNRYMAESLVQALGFNYDDIKNRMAEFRVRLNTIISEINQTFHVPKESNLIGIINNEFSRVFADSMGKKYQMYAFKPKCFLQFTAKAVTTGSALAAVITGTNRTVDTYFNEIEALMGSLRTNQDVLNMSGSLLRVYKEEGCAKIEYLEENHEVTIDYDPIMLQEIHNAIIVGDAFSDGNDKYGFTFNDNEGPVANQPLIALYQDANGILKATNQWNAATEEYFEIYKRNIVVDCTEEEPSAGDVIDSVAYMVGIGGVSKVSDTIYKANLVTSSDVVTNLKFFYFKQDGRSVAFDIQTLINNGSDEEITYVKDSDGVLLPLEFVLSIISKFDYCPRFIISRKDLNSANFASFISSYGKDCVIWDIYNFCFIGNTKIRLMHDTSWFGILEVPQNTASVSH